MYKAGDTVKFSNISLHKYTVFCKQGAGYIVNIVVSNLSVFCPRRNYTITNH